MSCKAKRSNGDRCKCPRYAKREKDEKCSCKHKLRDHHDDSDKASTAGSSASRASGQQVTLEQMVSKYNSTIDRIRSKASPSTARRETNSGFRVKSETKAGKSSSTKSSIKASKQKKTEPDYSKVGLVILLPDGLTSKDQLIRNTAPGGELTETYRRFGLAVAKDGARDVEYLPSWDQNQIDIWLRSLFPSAFTWLDACFGQPEDGGVQWVLLRKEYKKVYILQRDPMTGQDLADAQGTAKRSWRDYILYFCVRHAIPPAVYENWAEALLDPKAYLDQLDNSSSSSNEDNQSYGYDESDSDVLTDTTPPARVSVKHRASGSKAAATSTIDLCESDSDNAHALPNVRMTRSKSKGKQIDIPTIDEEREDTVEPDWEDPTHMPSPSLDALRVLHGTPHELPEEKENERMESPGTRHDMDSGCFLTLPKKRSPSPIENLEAAEAREGKRLREAPVAPRWFSQYSWHKSEQTDESATESSIASPQKVSKFSTDLDRDGGGSSSVLPAPLLSVDSNSTTTQSTGGYGGTAVHCGTLSSTTNVPRSPRKSPARSPNQRRRAAQPPQASTSRGFSRFSTDFNPWA